MKKYNLDSTEKAILKILQEDATCTIAQIAEQVNLSPTPCWRRINRMEKLGIIRKRVALVDPEVAGIPVSVFVLISIKQHSEVWLEQFTTVVNSLPQVMEFYRMSGETDYLMRVQVADLKSFDDFYRNLIASVSGLDNVTSSFAMEQIKYTTALPLER